MIGEKRATLLMLLVLCSAIVAFPNVGLVKAEGTIYIRADGSVEGTDTIQRDGSVYTFTDNIYEPLVVERDNIVVDGAGYSIEGPHTSLAQSPEGIGILVDSRSDVTISNVTIQHFLYGVCINSSSNNRITRSNITNNSKGIVIEHSSDTIIRESQIINNLDFGIRIMGSSVCRLVTQNNITNNRVGIHLEASSTCIQFNNIANNGIGIRINGSGNEIDHNNFIDNSKQVYDVAWDNPELSPSVNSWYEGDTGNHWSDYNGTEAYIIDENNKDNFPVMEPFTIPYDPWRPESGIFTISNMVWSLIIIGIALFLVIYFGKVIYTRQIKK